MFDYSKSKMQDLSQNAWDLQSVSTHQWSIHLQVCRKNIDILISFLVELLFSKLALHLSISSLHFTGYFIGIFDISSDIKIDDMSLWVSMDKIVLFHLVLSLYF